MASATSTPTSARGAGPASFGVEWLQRRTIAERVHDAHSLEIESLAELGLVGLALLLALTGAVVVAIRRVRLTDAALAAGPRRSAGDLGPARLAGLGLGDAGADARGGVAGGAGAHARRDRARLKPVGVAARTRRLQKLPIPRHPCVLLMRRLVLLLAGAALALPAAAAAKPAPPAPPAPESVPAFGMGHIKTEWLAGWANAPEGWDANGLADLGQMQSANTKLYRARMRYDQAWDGTGFTRWAMQDNLVFQAARRDITILPILIRMDANDAYLAPKTPADRQAFAGFAAAAARRYGPDGSFWASPMWTSCSDCGARHPIRVWEVWNEENATLYWNTPNPAADYGTTLQAVRASLRAADSTARVMVGGLADVLDDPLQGFIEPASFLRQVIGVVGKNGFDAVGVHSYHPDPAVAVDRVHRLADTLRTYAGVQANAPRQQIWATEFGRPTSPDTDAAESAQASFIATYVDQLTANRKAWNIGPLVPYMYGDAANATEPWQSLGLRHTLSDGTDGGPKRRGTRSSHAPRARRRCPCPPCASRAARRPPR